MADRYWVGDAVGGNFWGNPNAWSLVSGGAGGAGVPTVADDVWFDGGSVRDCTINVPNCPVQNLEADSLYTGAIQVAMNSVMPVAGAFSLGAGVTFLPGPLYLVPATPTNVTVTLVGQGVAFNGAGGGAAPTGAVTGFGVYNAANQLIIRGLTGTAYKVEANTVFVADTPGVTVRVQVFKVTNPAVPFALPDLLPAAAFDFVAGVTRTLANLNGAPLMFTPPTDDDYLLVLSIANPAAAPEAQSVGAGLTTRPVGVTPIVPTPSGPPIKVAPIIPAGAVQFQGGFIYNPALLTPWNMVGDWGLKVNQPTYAFNSFFVNSISGAPGIGQTIEFRCAIPPGRYTFRVWTPRGPDCGIFNVLMNGVALLTGADLYDPALSPGSVLAVPIVATAEGLQSIVFTVTGKNALSSNFYLRMHQFQLVPYLEGVI